MRIKLTAYSADLKLKSETWVNDKEPSDDYYFQDDQIIDLLARVNVKEVILRRPNGDWLAYSNIEYECMWCGAYDHKDDDCPDLDDTDEEEDTEPDGHNADDLADTDDPYDEADYQDSAYVAGKKVRIFDD